jgi:hypothetical protein
MKHRKLPAYISINTTTGNEKVEGQCQTETSGQNKSNIYLDIINLLLNVLIYIIQVFESQ